MVPAKEGEGVRRRQKASEGIRRNQKASGGFRRRGAVHGRVVRVEAPRAKQLVQEEGDHARQDQSADQPRSWHVRVASMEMRDDRKYQGIRR